jgi:tRNA(Ile)-lysidine synthase
MYDVNVQPLATNVLAYIRKHALLKAGDRVGVAVSGGADSVALLRLLLDLRAEIGIVLSVVHFNHQLRGAASDADAQFVGDLARHRKLDLHSENGDTAAYSVHKHLSIETAARELRYGYFRRLLTEARLNRVATAHTLDDQAETVLLKLTRGAGSRGLAGIYPQRSVGGEATIIRPLLATRRKDLEAYLKDLGQPWREDASNRDLRHARNRVRHGILPRLERFLNPAVREALAETAEIARAEEDFWQSVVAQELAQVWTQQDDSRGTLKSAALVALPLAFQRRVVRAAGESLGLRLEFHHVEDILALASTPSAKSTELPNGWIMSRNKHHLCLERKSGIASSDYEYPLRVPGSIVIPELNSLVEAVLVPRNRVEAYNPDHLLKRALLGNELRVRNWRPGDRFWPAHTKAPKKIKELLPANGRSSRERRLWPVVVSGSEVIWVRGLPTPAKLHPHDGDEAVAIQGVPLE